MRLRRVFDLSSRRQFATFEVEDQRLPGPGQSVADRPLEQGPHPDRVRALLGTEETFSPRTRVQERILGETMKQIIN